MGEIIRISAKVYGPVSWWRDALEGHLEVFPEGQLVAVDDRDGRVLGMAAGLIIRWDDYDDLDSWRDFTEGGLFTNHDPEGRTFYGAEVMVDPSQQGRGVGSLLYEARRELVQRLGLLRIRAGARIPGYRRYADRLSAQEYVRKIVAGEMRDPTLSFQLKRGFRVLQVVPGYLRHDAESLGYAVLIQWLNPEQATAEEFAAQQRRFQRFQPEGSPEQQS